MLLVSGVPVPTSRVPDGRVETNSLVATATTASSGGTDLQSGHQFGEWLAADVLTCGLFLVVGPAVAR
jgi:hypothetical protein